jgi:hypothetical protein
MADEGAQGFAVGCPVRFTTMCWKCWRKALSSMYNSAALVCSSGSSWLA